MRHTGCPLQRLLCDVLSMVVWAVCQDRRGIQYLTVQAKSEKRRARRCGTWFCIRLPPNAYTTTGDILADRHVSDVHSGTRQNDRRRHHGKRLVSRGDGLREKMRDSIGLLGVRGLRANAAQTPLSMTQTSSKSRPGWVITTSARTRSLIGGKADLRILLLKSEVLGRGSQMIDQFVTQ